MTGERLKREEPLPIMARLSTQIGEESPDEFSLMIYKDGPDIGPDQKNQ